MMTAQGRSVIKVQFIAEVVEQWGYSDGDDSKHRGKNQTANQEKVFIQQVDTN